MVSIDLWRYELDFLNLTAIGTTTDEIKSLYPWLRTKGFSSSDFEKYPFYDMNKFVLRHYMRRTQGANRKREVEVFDNVSVKFNPAAFMDLVMQVKDYKNRDIGDLYLFATKYPEFRGWLLPKAIMEPLANKPWADYARLIEHDNKGYAVEKKTNDTCYIEEDQQFRIH